MTTNTTSVATETDNVTRLPDGSAFAIASFPLPDSHWLYAPRESADGADVPKELPRPILSHTEHREAVVAAIRYAVRGATMCGKEPDFDPDALVQNAVYALCGPFGGQTTLAEKITLAAGQATAAPAEPDPTPGDHPQPCDSELFESGVSVGLFDIPQWTAEALCKGIAAATGARVDWHYIGGRVHVKALPAPTSDEFAAAGINLEKSS